MSAREPAGCRCYKEKGGGGCPRLTVGASADTLFTSKRGGHRHELANASGADGDADERTER
jgi:hypothetical protein